VLRGSPPRSRAKLQAITYAALAGVGDASAGEWVEWTGANRKTCQVRSRLSAVESLVTGPPRDIRGTPEAMARIERVHKVAPYIPLRLLMEENKKR
jgi:hypothetical protein